MAGYRRRRCPWRTCWRGARRGRRKATARQVGVLHYCRASFERVGHEVGALYGGQRPRVEAALARKLRVPRGTRGVSVSMDRVAVPMEEPKRRRVGRPRKGAATRPVDVVWRMAYAACLTFHDAHGEALGTLRYGRMPRGEARGLAERLARDVQALVSRRRGLYVAVLTDGAPELHALLDEALATHAPSAKKPVRLVDFWHLMEKLGSAARVVAGEEKASALREKWKLSLLNMPGAAWAIAMALHASGKRHAVLGDGQPVHEALTYLENHGERMHYAEARARGLPIGSGNVEATCKSLVTLRMKRPGARWEGGVWPAHPGPARPGALGAVGRGHAPHACTAEGRGAARSMIRMGATPVEPHTATDLCVCQF